MSRVLVWQCFRRSDAAYGQLQLVQLLHDKRFVRKICFPEQQLTQETFDENL